jgi:DNA-binding HxlR family transcriptional regulator
VSFEATAIAVTDVRLDWDLGSKVFKIISLKWTKKVLGASNCKGWGRFNQIEEMFRQLKQ